MKQKTDIKTLDDLFNKWYLSLLEHQANKVLNSEYSVQLAAKKVSVQTGEDFYDVEEDLVEVISKIGNIAQVDFI